MAVPATEGRFVKTLVRCTLLAASTVCALAQAQDERFDVHRYQVEGNTLLAPAHVEALVAPFVGHKRNYGDIQKALEALENAYRSSGYGTVQVYVPEQELTQGVVRLQVTEGVVGKIVVNGNQHFDAANIRATLPDLQEGRAPNMRKLSENIQLANENPAKQVEVTLGVGEEEGKVDAKINVTDEKPEKFIFTLDTTGSSGTGRARAGFAYQNANVGNSDQVLTLAYTMAPDKPKAVDVDIYSIAYRVPFYGIGDSLDIIYGKSSVNTPIAQATGFNLAGKGDVFGLRWNHYFPRRGEYTSKLIVGLDYKYINTTCTINGNPTPVGTSADCTPYTLRPLSLAYAGQRQSPGEMLDYNISVQHNLPMGARYAFSNTYANVSGTDRYSLVASNRQVPDDFAYYKGAFNYLRALPEDWTLRASLNIQVSQTALPSPEQIGIAGSTAVRGFNERAVSGDKGFYVNLEAYTPEIADLVGLTGSLKALAFYDFGRSDKYQVDRTTQETSYSKAGIASVGFGLRYSLGKDVSLKLDFAHVVDAGPANVKPGTTAAAPANTESKGDWRGHFGLQLAY